MIMMPLKKLQERGMKHKKNSEMRVQKLKMYVK